MGGSVDQVWDRIERWLAANARAVLVGLNPPATEVEIAETEQLIGVRLPDDVRASYLRHDGQADNSTGLLEGWEWLSLAGVRHNWRIWKSLLDEGAFADFESEADGTTVRKDWWNSRWVPLTFSGSGDHVCVDLDPGPQGTYGQVIEMWHDDAPRPVRAPSFLAWLNQFADELDSGEWVYSEEHIGLCRQDEL